MKINYELIKEAISKFGYSMYVQDVVCDYFLIETLGLSSKELGVSPNERCLIKSETMLFFNDMKSKDHILNHVIPSLVSNVSKFIN